MTRKKIEEEEPLVPILFGEVTTSIKHKMAKQAKILLDSGASGSIVSERFVKRFKQKKDETCTWKTMAGSFTTSKQCIVEFTLPELNPTAKVRHKMYVVPTMEKYDLIIGRDILQKLGMNLDFEDKVVRWNGNSASMKLPDCANDFNYNIRESFALQAEDARVQRILDASYEKADIKQVVQECTHLSKKERHSLYTLLRKFEPMFDGKLGRWKGKPYDIELKPDVTPYHSRPFSLPKCYEKTLRKEVERLCKIGVLKRVNRSEWGAPTFIIPKKDQTVRFISDFRELNKRIKRKPYPIPRIQDLLLKLEGFTYATSLDLNMGYYHIELSPMSKQMCTIVLPWGKYEYQKLPMGLCNSPDIFQEKMSTLFHDFENVRAYIDDLLVLGTGTWDEHLQQIEEVLKRLQGAGLKVNCKKSFFGRHELEYLGYWITREGVMPIPKKVQAIQDIAPPKTKKQLRRFIGMVNYYRDMWVRRSETLAPLTALTSKEVKWVWTDVHQKAFDKMKKIVAREVLLSYPNFNELFEIHTDASATQLGAVISQKGRPIAFYSRKLNPAQTRYTTTERELLAIVETLKEFKNILLGQRIRVYTDHKNLTYKTFNTDRVLRWRLILEEFSPELIYIKGQNNVIADALSRLDKTTDSLTKPISKLNGTDFFTKPFSKSNGTDNSTKPISESVTKPHMDLLAELYALEEDDLPEDAFPITYSNILKHQQKDKKLLKLFKSSKVLKFKEFHGGGRSFKLICNNENKIVMPQALQIRTVQWYHRVLCHPGETRTELTIKQHFTWPNMRKDVHKVCSRCDTCLLTKRNNKRNYGLLPEKKAESEPWEILCVDLIGPYPIPTVGRRKKNEPAPLQLWAVTMIDPATGWLEIKDIKTKRADVVSNVIEKTWLTRYPRPSVITLDRGKEFMAEVTKMIKNDYGIKKRPITVRNPQANSIIERVHQTISNIIRTFAIYDTTVDMEDPWSGILSATMFAIRSTVHTTTQHTPMQLVFGRDSFLNISHDANWKFIKERKQRLIKINNQRENRKRIPYNYKIGDKVIVKGEQSAKYANAAYRGPYTVTAVNNNGTVRIDMGIINDVINIRNVHPYRMKK